MTGGYEALNAKVKGMYGKRLRHADYLRMARMASVDEVLDDLRRHPVWGGAADRLLRDGGRFGRAQVEAALREQLREEYLRLLAFVPRRDRALMEFPVLRAELDGLLFTLSRLRAGHPREPEPLPIAFIRQSKTDEDALFTCRDYDGLLDATRESIYYRPLLDLRRPGGALPDYTAAESALYTAYYRHMLDVIQKRYEGDARAALQRDLGAQVDLLNIMHILRLKRFFPEERDLLTVLYPVRHRLKAEQVKALCDAPDLESALAVVEGTPYAEVFRGAEMAELDRLYDGAVFRLSRRQVMLGKPSVYTAVAFLHLRELELEELTGVIETVKYQAAYDDRLVRSIGS